MTDSNQTEATELSFDAMNLSPAVRQAIADIGWDTPTECQFQAFGPAREGRDLIVQSRTGTGKTAAFGLPLVDGVVDETPGVQALILAPTRELALQSAREIGRLGVHREVQTTAIYGGAPMDKQVRELDRGTQIVSGTPGRVLDHLRRGTLKPDGLKVLVLDEADEMLSMGFAKELHAIMEMLPEKRQTLLFSATVDGPVQRMGERHMTEPVHLELSGDAVGALGVTHYVYMVTGAGRARDLAKIIEVEDPESGIIFCNTKAETEQVAAYLQQVGYTADWLNGDLPQSHREKVMKQTREGKLRFLVATDVAARGIDISHVTHVINFALPEHLEQYIHRTGRTGRAGRTGTAISLVAPQELGVLYYLRLQYKIFPIERSLPSRGEEQTRREMDRVEMLQAAFKAHTPSELDLAVARRLLTHDGAERILASLVASFFGTTTDEEAAEARRAKAPTPVAEEKAEEKSAKSRKDRDRKERSRDGSRRERGARKERSERSERKADKRESSEARGEQRAEEQKTEKRRDNRRRDRRRQRREETVEAADEAVTDTMEALPSEDTPVAPVEAAEAAEAPRNKDAAEAQPAQAEETAGSTAPESTEAAATESAATESADAGGSDDGEQSKKRRRRDEEEGFARLYVNLGRRDGMRVSDLNEMFQEDAGLKREEVGRIRLRDKHSFVSVPVEKVDEVIASLLEIEVDGRDVKVELAKN